MKKLNDPFAPTPEGFHLRVEQTLNGLEEREMTRRKLTVGLAVALAVMLITATAVAATVGGYIGWDGIYHSYSDEDAQSPVAYTEDIVPEPAIPSILENIPEGEYWQIAKNGKILYSEINHRGIHDAHEMTGLMSQSALPVPNIPEGFTLSAFSIGTNPSDTPYEESLLWDGSTLTKYKLMPINPEKADNYYCLLKDEDGRYITANAWLGSVTYEEHIENFRWDLASSGEYSAVEVDGFDNALYIDDNDGIHWLLLLRETDCGNLSIHVHADSTVSKDELLGIFAPVASAENTVLPDVSTLDMRPDDAEIFALERDLSNELLKDIPDGEYWRVERTVPAGAYMSSIRYPEVNFTEAATLLAGANIPVPVIPDRFTVCSAELHVPTENKPYEEISLETGAVLMKYRLQPATTTTIVGYTLNLADAAGARIHIYASPDWKPEYGEPVSVDGFDRADYLSSASLDTPEIHILSLSRKTDGSELVIRIVADSSISKTTLLSLF